VVVAVALSLPVFGSEVDDVTVAVFEMTVLSTTVASTFTVSVKTAEPMPSDAIEQLTGPVPPTAGAEHDQPPGAESDTNVVPAGSVSLSETVAALLGPAFDAVMVYVMFVPASTGSGVSTFVIERSADAEMVSVSVAELLTGVGSVTPAGAATVAVLLKVPVAEEEIVALTV
jgi:hypothetical protein